MIYYHDDEVTIRDMEDADAMIIAAAEIAQGDHVSVEKYQTRLRDRAEGRCAALVAEYCGCAAGYVNVYYDSTWGAFAKRGLCEIVDFGVLEKYRRRGIGKKLMDAAEALAFEKADAVYLGVGLHAGYGSAQRMYIKRGYVPDGSGAWYKDTACAPYGACANDDELVLYLSKSAPSSDGRKAVQLCGVCILTNDAPRLAAFYETILCEKPFAEGAHYGFNGAQLAVYDPGDVKVVPEKNMSVMFYVNDVLSEYGRLTRELPGIVVTSPERRPWGAYSFWFLDPDGNTVSFIEKREA